MVASRSLFRGIACCASACALVAVVMLPRHQAHLAADNTRRYDELLWLRADEYSDEALFRARHFNDALKLEELQKQLERASHRPTPPVGDFPPHGSSFD